MEELKVAPPPPPPKLSQEQMKAMYEDEENTLRELRIFLRQICSKLARNKQFYMFSKPVDIKEVPDYLQIIKEPMDLETMMTKIDLHKYACAQDFLSDVDLLCRNALEYNPDRDPADKLIRHRACYLRDTAYALIKAEMDSDFEVSCRNIREARKNREENSSQRFIREFFKDDCEVEESVKEDKEKDKEKENKDDSKKRARKSMKWSKGIVGKRPRRTKQSPDPSKTEEASGSNCGDSTTTEDILKKDEDNLSETESQVAEKDQKNERNVQIDRNKLSSLFDRTLAVTKDIDQVDMLADLYLSFRTIIDSYKGNWDRNNMIQQMEKELNTFEIEHERLRKTFS